MANLTKISFPLNCFWIHVTMNGSMGTDQNGDRWIMKGNRLYSEFSSRIVDLNSKEVYHD